MASVSSVASADFRTSLLPAQNNAPDAEGDDPFSQLLNAVGNGNTNGSNASAAAAPDAPRAAERRDAPAKQQKSDAGDDRQAKRNAKQTDKPEAKTQTETSAPVKQPASEDDSDDTDADTAADDSAAADALLLALNETQPQAAAAADATDAGGATPAAADAQAPVTDGEGALAAAIADAAASEKQTAQTAQNTAPVKGQVEAFAASLQAEPEAEALPAKTVADTLSSLPKTVKTAAHFEAASQIQGQPQTSANLATTNAVHAPAPLEMLTAALSKHSQLTAAHDGVDAAPDTQKPLISSNAVAPNFALTTQVAAPISVQTQQAADTARSVPLESLAVEIATRAGKGERRFDIRLDPPELGRIDVRLEIDHKGNTTTKLIVERSETLDLLQRDARGLEKALQNAGLKTDAGGLEFSLRQDTQTQQGQQSHAPDMRGRTEPVQADAEVMTEITVGNASLAAQLRGGVDIRI